ncbi:MAG: 50S ribosomal protein L22 [Candidatus Moraniibacteriota bacterium]|nr:MAG: 50S ribosomal protein L22 [Candidatus Moranbacteria bacterium]
MTKVTAQLNNVRISPRKVRLVADRVRGMGAEDAIGLLQYDLRKSAQPMEKLIKSAIANAQNNHQLRSEDLVIADIVVGEGPTLKRWMPRAYGRASKILKRTSRVRVVLSEKETETKPAEKKARKNAKSKEGNKDNKRVSSQKKPQNK